ncbi:ABC transporter ATP-binding protein [Bowmanella pacifica]|uniref:ABC transporter domain-containing protein n=1 Tax=Bowmanella pacifica TaxID=502051 RepID=A0A917Z1X5_9ALTE|nr:ABC transporter ATP-binding protein [Bowmanella pacifica]GGO72573.1 hypothetical protein GCM10010982_31020 [Bowmanella pacifica]
MLKLTNLCAGYAGPRGKVLSNVALSVAAGTFVCVVGRNGVGKSTLLRTISGLQGPLMGEVSLNQVNLHEMTAQSRARLISVVTTDRISSPGLTARDVIELGRQPYTNWRGQLTQADKAAVENAMHRLNTKRFADKPLDGLSDGERQRVMISRALAQNADVMVLDEITAFLDLPGRVEVMSLLRRYAHTSEKIVLLSSHDLELSLELADQIWIVDDGKVVCGSATDKTVQNALSSAFDTSDVAYDPSRRQFKLKQASS